MPLIHSSSPAALKQNMRTLMGEVGRSPHVQSKKQAQAIAMETQRRARAVGGPVYRDLGGAMPVGNGMAPGDPVSAVISALQQGTGGVAAPTMGDQPAPQNAGPRPVTVASGVAPTGPLPSPGSVPQNAPAVPAPSQTIQAGVMGPSIASPGGGGVAPDSLMGQPLLKAAGGPLHRAGGGFNMAQGPHLSPSWETMAEARSMHTGPILSAVPGRTDNHRTRVPSGSYVLPAAHIASMGQGNSMAGLSIAHQMFGGGPYGTSTPRIPHGRMPRAPAPYKFAAGGHHDDHVPVECALSGGEYVIPPRVVRMIGNGNLKHGHSILDNWVMQRRKREIDIQRKLPPPAKD